MKRPAARRRAVGRLHIVAGGWGWVFRRSRKFDPWHLYALIRWPASAGKLAWEVERREAEMAKKPEIIAGNGTSSPTLKAGAALSKFPVLRSYLIDTSYEGGNEPRQQSYLIVRPSPVAWSVVLKDPSTGLQLRASAEQYDLLFGVLEALLTSPECPWEVDPYASLPGAKKRKR